MKQDFLLICDPKIWAIPIKDCGEPLIDLSNEFPINNKHMLQYDGFTQVRKSVAEKLLRARSKLPSGFNFLFSEGYRPLSVQTQIYHQYLAKLSQENPTWDKEELQQRVAEFIAPPEDVPPHSTGGAFDICMLDVNGQPLEMGGELDAIPDKARNLNFTWSSEISAVAKQNRQLLWDILTAVGFVNYPAEWWHWSYGDKYWAYHTGNPFAIYGSI